MNKEKALGRSQAEGVESRETLRGRPTEVHNVHGGDRRSHEAVLSGDSGGKMRYSASAQPVDEAQESVVSLGILSNPEEDDDMARRKSWIGSPKRLLQRVKTRKSLGVNPPERVRARALKAKAEERKVQEEV